MVGLNIMLKKLYLKGYAEEVSLAHGTIFKKIHQST